MRCEAADIKPYTNLVKPLNRETRILKRGIHRGEEIREHQNSVWVRYTVTPLTPGIPPRPKETPFNHSIYIVLIHPQAILYAYTVLYPRPGKGKPYTIWIYRVGGGNGLCLI